MSRPVMRVAWYRLRSTLGDRWPGYLAVTLLIGLIGGLALGAVAAARRTQSAFPAYLASTSPSDLTVLTGLSGVSAPGRGYDPALVRTIARLPGVRRVESYGLPDAAVLAPDGALRYNARGVPGSIDGEYFNQDRVTIVQGRMADPGRAGEAVIDAKGTPARIRVGEVIPFAFFTNAQESSPDFGRPGMRPYLRINVRVVGKVIFSQEAVQDEADAGRDGGILFAPALTRRLAGCCIFATESAVRLADGSSGVAAAEARIEQALPRGFPVEFYVTSLTEAKAERAIQPVSIALAVFGGITGLAALIIASQLIGRQIRLGADDLVTLRALGASPAMTVGEALPGVLAAVLAGAMLAVAVAIGLSPLAPLGTVRAVYPYPGVAFDWTVLGGGGAVLTGVLALVAVALAYRAAPHRAAPARVAGQGSAIVRAAAGLGVPPPVVEGIRLAIDPGRGRAAVPVRSAILGAALAMIVVVGTVTFGASLDTLVSHPALYGWNWTYALSAGNPAYISRARAAAALDHDPAVAAWTGIYFATFKIDGLTVPVIGASPNAPVGPPVLSGHGLRAAGQIVLGRATLAQLNKHVGDEVTVEGGATRRARLRIVGTATLPSYGVFGTLHTEMGTGAVADYRLIPGATPAQPNDVLVTLGPGANGAAARARLQRLVPAAGGGQVLAVQRPAEIVNYRSMGATPAYLGAALAAGAVAALGLTLLASVRRRRRDLALLKTIGFTRRQLAVAVAWQSSIAVAAGTVIGVPVGIALGRFLWNLFAGQISVVPEPTVPGLAVIAIIAGALVLANVVAVVPGRMAGRTPTALLLRAE
ncbi:MAG TPA: FtsX-like permease family protein [Streptosporangiaceae bacterium]|nr:FtsX-like permease family protein [Streptosporangiaceae bacterium]